MLGTRPSSIYVQSYASKTRQYNISLRLKMCQNAQHIACDIACAHMLRAFIGDLVSLSPWCRPFHVLLVKTAEHARLLAFLLQRSLNGLHRDSLAVLLLDSLWGQTCFLNFSCGMVSRPSWMSVQQEHTCMIWIREAKTFFTGLDQSHPVQGPMDQESGFTNRGQLDCSGKPIIRAWRLWL